MLYLLFLLILFYATHSFFASTRIKGIFKNYFPALFKFYRFFYSAFSIILLGYIGWRFYVHHEFHFIFKQQIILHYAGTGMMFLGLILVLWSVFNYSITEFLGIDRLMFRENPAPAKFIVRGMNQYVRHPIYTGLLLFFLGLLLWLPTLMTLMVVLISLIYLDIGMRLEEKKLVAEFGEQYRNYQKEVKKVIPFLY